MTNCVETHVPDCNGQAHTAAMKFIRLKRRDTLLACGKCLKRHPKGKAIRRALKTCTKGVDVALVRTTCFGICPRRAVLVASSRSLASVRAVLITDEAEVEVAVETLTVPHASEHRS